MTKVEILGGDVSAGLLERQINSFIRDKKVINISYAAYMCGYSSFREACVIYEDTQFEE